MFAAYVLWSALLGLSKPEPLPAPDANQFPLALHRSMEIDDLDREIQHLHDTSLYKRAQLAVSQRLALRGVVSRSDLERETADVRYNEAREAETIAFRAIKVYERDMQGQVVAHDERKVYALLLDLLKKREAMAQVDADYKGYILKQTRALFQRKAISRQELEAAELDFDSAQAGVALNRSREAQVEMELAARRGEKPFDPAEYDRLKADYLNARIHYFEIAAEGARRRLEVARERSKRGLIPTNELPLFEKAAADADAALASEREKLEAARAPKRLNGQGQTR